MHSINFIRNNLNIKTPMVQSSALGIKTTKSQRLADICDYFKATEYISGQGGKKYLDTSVFNCKVNYFKPEVDNYYTTLQHIFNT